MNFSFILAFALFYSCVNAKPASWFDEPTENSSEEQYEYSNEEPIQRQPTFYPHKFHLIGVNPQNGNIVFYDRPWLSQNDIDNQDNVEDKIIFRPDIPSTTRKPLIFEDDSSDNGLSPTRDGTSTSRPDWITTTVSFINQYPDFPPGTVNACQRQCMKSVTSEYNPSCGSDGVTYSNPGKVICAERCGKNITTRYGVCGLGSPQV